MFGPDDPTVDSELPGEQPTAQHPIPRTPASGGSPRTLDARTGAPDRPAQVGGYTIVRVLGRGGMGIVFEAEQKHPRRRVALKVIRSSRVSPGLLRRFEYESQVLARLQHPGIAQIYQAGTLKDRHGQTTPYFSMELIDGEPLTSYAETNQLGTRERLELVARICDAVYHAHQKGVIHRDLKPSNILVNREGQPKILDFGVARATASDVQQTTMRTDVGQIVGTVQYMSPEQAAGIPEDIDTRSDVYALGVILFEVVAGQLPYDVRRVMLHEAIRAIREEDPVRLSSVNRTLRGDVETIVAKALEKDRDRRYQSADALASEIRRYLADEPILARPAGTLYKIGKFSRRNKGLTIGVLGASAALVAGMVATGLALARALAAESGLASQLAVVERARDIAERERQQADEARRAADEDRTRATLAEAEATRRADELEQVTQFHASILKRFNPANAGRQLTADVLVSFDRAMQRRAETRGGNAEPWDAEGFRRQWGAINATDLARDFIVRALLKPAVKSLDRKFGDDPVLDARLRQVLADRYSDIGLYQEAMPLQERALAARIEFLGADHPSTRISRRSMGDLLYAQGRREEAAVHYREAKEERPQRRRSAIGRVLELDGRDEEAERYLRAMLEQSRKAKGDDHAATLRLLDQLGSVLHGQGRLEEAEAVLRQAVEAGRSTLRESSVDLLAFEEHLGAVLLDASRLDEAEPLLLETLKKRRRVLGEEHPETIVAAVLMGALHEAVGRHEQAVTLLERVEPPARSAFASGHAQAMAMLLQALGEARTALDRFEPAQSALLEAHTLLAAEHGGSIDDLRRCALALARLHERWHAARPGEGHDVEAVTWRERSAAADG